MVSAVSWMSAAVRNSCAARSPRSTEMRNPASRIKAVAVAHGRDCTVVDRACLVFPVSEEIGESGVPPGFGGEESKPDTKCVRSAAMDLGQLVERVLFVGVESNGRRRHVRQCSTNVLHVVDVRDRLLLGCIPERLRPDLDTVVDPGLWWRPATSRRSATPARSCSLPAPTIPPTSGRADDHRHHPRQDLRPTVAGPLKSVGATIRTPTGRRVRVVARFICPSARRMSYPNGGRIASPTA